MEVIGKNLIKINHSFMPTFIDVNHITSFKVKETSKYGDKTIIITCDSGENFYVNKDVEKNLEILISLKVQ